MRTGVRALAALAVVGLLVIGGWGPGQASAAIQLRTLTGFELATFKSVNCRVAKGKGFTATGKYGGWKLTVRVYDFSGFHRYIFEYGAEGPADFFATAGAITFSNIAKPETGSLPELTDGGSIGFPEGRKKLGIGFPLAYRIGDFEQQASLVGRAPCK